MNDINAAFKTQFDYAKVALETSHVSYWPIADLGDHVYLTKPTEI
jgi:hypothetical protein